MKPNPFLISGYKSPELFCNRHLESGKIIRAISNQRNITLISSRRMGKTGLILHVFHDIRSNNEYIPIYFDILGTTSLNEFVETFSSALMTQMAKTESSIRRFMKKLATLRPGLSMDPFTGEPRLSLDIRSEKEAETSLDIIFRLMDQNKRPFVIAIDEFQQVASYPEKNSEAILRTHIQHAGNSRFIFSGSKKHMLADMFSQPSRPLFSSTEMMFLDAIDRKDYFAFIMSQFSKRGKTIQKEALEAIEAYTNLHTFYVQFLCNRLFSAYKNVGPVEVSGTIHTILKENEPIYANFLNLLTTTQYKTLRAIALEGRVANPTAGHFLAKHSLGAHSSVAQAVDSLTKKEFISHESDGLILQDKFFGQWIRMKSG